MAGSVGSLTPVHTYTPRTEVGQLNAEFKQIYDTLNTFDGRYVLLDGSNIMSGNLTTPGVRLTSTTELTLASTAHAFQIGATGSANLAADANEIQARNNGAAAQLDLNPHGGTVTTGGNLAVAGSATIGGNTAWHAGNDGAGSGLDSDTVDGAQLSAFAHERVFLGAGAIDLGTGTTKVIITNRSTVNFPNASGITNATTWFTLPPWALNQSCTITAYYTSATAGTNAARISIIISAPGSGNALNANLSTYTVDVAMPAGANTVGVTNFTTAFSAGAGPLYSLYVQRDSDHANDTFTGAFNLLGVLIRRT